MKRHKPIKTDNFIDKSQNDEETNNMNKKRSCKNTDHVSKVCSQ